MHLKQLGFTYSACGPFTKNKERIEKFMQTGNTDFIYKNELEKDYFHHDMAYGKSKDIVRRIQSDILREIASDSKYGGYQRELASMVYKFFDKESIESGAATSLEHKSTTEPNYQLANERYRLLETLREEKFIYILETIAGVQIQLTRNH